MKWPKRGEVLKFLADSIPPIDDQKASLVKSLEGTDYVLRSLNDSNYGDTFYSAYNEIDNISWIQAMKEEKLVPGLIAKVVRFVLDVKKGSKWVRIDSWVSSVLVNDLRDLLMYSPVLFDEFISQIRNIWFKVTLITGYKEKLISGGEDFKMDMS